MIKNKWSWNSTYRRKTIKPDLSDPIKRKQWYRDKIIQFMWNKFSNPEDRRIFQEKINKGQIPYEQLNIITQAMRKEEDAKKKKFQDSQGSYTPFDRSKRPR